MKLIRLLLRDAPAATITAILAGVVSGAANAALLAIVNERLTGQVQVNSALLITFGVLILAAPLSRVLSSWLMVRLSQRAVHQLRMDLSHRILSAPLRDLERVGHHRLQAAIHEDIGSLAVALAGVPLLCIHSAIVLGLLVYLGWISLFALGLLVGFAVLGIAVYYLSAVAAIRHQRHAREHSDALHDGYLGVIRGTKELKLHGPRRVAFLEHLEGLGRKLQHYNVAAATTYSIGGSWTQMLAFVALGVVVLGGGLLPVELGPETLTTYTVVILYLLTPLQVLVNAVPDLAAAEVAHEKTRELGLSLLEGRPDPERTTPQPVGFQRIDLVGVSHRYRAPTGKDTFTLGPVNLSLEPGQLVFVIGGNGSGKTTLAKLLVGLYKPESGEVRLNGEPVEEGQWERFRQHFSAIFSDFYLFDTFLGLENQDLDARAQDHLRRLQLEEKVGVSEGGLTTLDLSQGQRKRLALLTVSLEDRPVLVFDEWAADQDPLFRDFFYRRLLPDLRDQGKTAVVITHDDRYFDIADRVVKLEYGSVVLDQEGDFEASPEALGGAPSLAGTKGVG